MVNNPIKKWAKDLDRYFCKEDIQLASKCMKRYSESLAIREMQIKTIMQCYVQTTRMARIKKTDNNNDS